MPVIAFTFFFGVFGAISAARRSGKARALGLSTKPYWIAFAATLVVGYIVAFAVIMAISAALSGQVNSDSVENSIIAEKADFSNDTAGATPTVANCSPSQVESNGAGTYSCTVTFSAGEPVDYLITVDSDGNGVPATGS